MFSSRMVGKKDVCEGDLRDWIPEETVGHKLVVKVDFDKFEAGFMLIWWCSKILTSMQKILVRFGNYNHLFKGLNVYYFRWFLNLRFTDQLKAKTLGMFLHILCCWKRLDFFFFLKASIIFFYLSFYLNLSYL